MQGAGGRSRRPEATRSMSATSGRTVQRRDTRRGARRGRVEQEILADIDRNVDGGPSRPLSSRSSRIRVLRALPAPNSTSERGCTSPTSPRAMRVSRPTLGAGEVVLGKPGDGLEELRSALVVEVARRDGLRRARQTARQLVSALRVARAPEPREDLPALGHSPSCGRCSGWRPGGWPRILRAAPGIRPRRRPPSIPGTGRPGIPDREGSGTMSIPIRRRSFRSSRAARRCRDGSPAGAGPERTASRLARDGVAGSSPHG